MQVLGRGGAEKGPRAGGEAAWPETPLSRRLTASSSWPLAESHLSFRGRESDLCLPIARLSQRVIKMMSVNTPQTGLAPTSVERASGVSRNAPAVRRRGKKGGNAHPSKAVGEVRVHLMSKEEDQNQREARFRMCMCRCTRAHEHMCAYVHMRMCYMYNIYYACIITMR